MTDYCSQEKKLNAADNSLSDLLPFQVSGLCELLGEQSDR